MSARNIFIWRRRDFTELQPPKDFNFLSKEGTLCLGEKTRRKPGGPRNMETIWSSGCEPYNKENTEGDNNKSAGGLRARSSLEVKETVCFH